MNELMTKATLAREAAPLIASCSAEAKNDALMRIADALIAHTDEIAEANRDTGIVTKIKGDCQDERIWKIQKIR